MAKQLCWEDDSPVIPGGPAKPKAKPTDQPVAATAPTSSSPDVTTGNPRPTVETDLSKVSEYDPATDLLHEFVQLLAGIDAEWRGDDLENAIRGRCRRLGKHGAPLIQLAPQEQLDSFWNRVVINGDGNDSTLTMVYSTGQTKKYPLVRIHGRWLPRPLAESLLKLPGEQREKVREIQSLPKARLEGRIHVLRRAARSASVFRTTDLDESQESGQRR